MPYPSEGTLTTDVREVEISETWDSQSEWSAYQSASNVVVNNGVVMLEESSVPSPSDLLAHYDATDSSSITTSQWDDLSGNGNHLTGTISSIASGRINSLDAAYFDASVNVSTAFGSSDAQPTNIFIVHEPKWSANSQTVFDGATGNNQRYFNSGGNEAFFAGNMTVASSTAVQTTNPQITELLFDGASSELRKNDSTITTGDPGSNALDGVTLGSGGGDSFYTEVYIGEVLVYSTPPTRSEVYSYLGRWGIV